MSLRASGTSGSVGRSVCVEKDRQGLVGGAEQRQHRREGPF